MNDKPDSNGLMGDSDCLTLWTIRAAQAAGLEHEVFCAIMSDAQELAELHPDDCLLVRNIMHDRWHGVQFTVPTERQGTDGWALYIWVPNWWPIPVAFSPTGWQR